MKIARRGFWLCLMLAGLSVPLVNGIRDVRMENEMKTLLLHVQEALQRFHVEQERYIPREEMTGAELLSVLEDFDYLNDLPHNPWTRKRYTLEDGEADGLRYRSSGEFMVYSLQARDPSTDEVLLELDSEALTSLE